MGSCHQTSAPSPRTTHTHTHRSTRNTRNMDKTTTMMMMASSAILLLLAADMAESQPAKNTPTHSVRDKTMSKCLELRGAVLNGTLTLPDGMIPKCDGRGRFDPRQIDTTGKTWCVDPDTGDVIEPYDTSEDGKIDCVGHKLGKQQSIEK